MPVCTLEKVRGPYHTFLPGRFDRDADQRIHFASAMTMTGNSEDTIRDVTPSYLKIAEFIQNYGSNIEEDMDNNALDFPRRSGGHVSRI